MIRVGIIGASGYTGLELIKIITAHPRFTLTYLGVSQEESRLQDLHPSLKGVLDIPVTITDTEQIKQKCDLLFLATPHTSSMQYVHALSGELNEGKLKIVDLSADYRLEADCYETHYTKHIDKANLASAVYGLPEYYKEQIQKSNLVANPGCYPTASLLGLLPFGKYLDETRDVFIDAKSGVSGAGKQPNDIKHFVSVNESALVYSPLTHRHEPEITEKLAHIANKQPSVHFVPTLLPITRGMQSNIYFYTTEDIEPLDILREQYANAPFVRIFDKPTGLKNTSGTNFCDIFATKKTSTQGNLIFVSTNIDNLLRGASSQAVVNANLMCGLPEDEGISKISFMP